MSHRVIILGNSAIVESFALGLRAAGATLTSIVSLPPREQPLNSVNIAEIAERSGVQHHEISGYVHESEMAHQLLDEAPDYILSAWSKVIKETVLAVPKYFTIGTHPTRLPYGRGRHPLHWLIAMGIEETCLSFFRMTEKIDDGPILWRYPFELPFGTTILQANQECEHAAQFGTKVLFRKLEREPNLPGEAQIGYFRARTELVDCTILPTMTKLQIIRLVNSYSEPYPCCILMTDDQIELRISEATVEQVFGSFPFTCADGVVFLRPKV